MNTKEFYWCIEETLDMKPTLTLDDGADLIMTVHTKPKEARTHPGRHRGDHHRCAPSARAGR